MRNFSFWLCLTVVFPSSFAVKHKSSRSDAFDIVADIMEDSGLPTNLLEDFSMSNLAAKIPFLQQPQPGTTQSGGPVQYIQNLAPLGLGQFLGGLLGSATPSRPGVSTQYPAYPSAGDTSIMSALTAIAKYDDYKCVPRLLCEVAAGGRPGEKQQAFGGRNTVLSLLSLIGGDMTSPVVVFGRAMLLGLTVQGDPGTCFSAYPSCPRDPNRLVDYLNNHRGGIFRFFSATGLPAYYTQQYSQARIQTPYKPLPMPQASLRPPRVTINTDNGHRHLLPQRKVLTHKTLPSFDSRPTSVFQKPLAFPGDRAKLYSAQLGEDQYYKLPEVQDSPRSEPHFSFPDRARVEESRQETSTESHRSPINHNIHRLPPPVAVQLPDRTGTGDLRLDNDETTFGTPAYPARFKRDVHGLNNQNSWKQRMVFPLDDLNHSKAARKLKFPSDTRAKTINFPSESDSTSVDDQKIKKQNSAKDHLSKDKPRELIVFPNSTNEKENNREPKRYSMKFPSGNTLQDSFDDNTVNVSFQSETSKNKKRTYRMKFPVEDFNERGKADSIINKDQNTISKVKFQNIQDGFREISTSGTIFPYSGVKDSSNSVRFLENTATL